MIFADEHNYKRLPAIAKSPFRDRLDQLIPKIASPKCRVALFSACVQDFVYPEHLEAAMKGFEAAGAEVVFPMDQSCCGLPAVSMGETAVARDVALQNLTAFDGEDVDNIVTLCASSASHLKHGVPDLLRSVSPSKALQFADKVVTFSQFMAQKAGENIPRNGPGKKVAFHSPCHLCRGLGEKQAPHELIGKSGNTFVKTDEEETCCGFGGSFSAHFPAVSRELLSQKLDDVEGTDADLLATECPGCVMPLRGGAAEQGRDLKVVHLAELLYPE